MCYQPLHFLTCLELAPKADRGLLEVTRFRVPLKRIVADTGDHGCGFKKFLNKSISSTLGPGNLCQPIGRRIVIANLS